MSVSCITFIFVIVVSVYTYTIQNYPKILTNKLNFEMN